MCGLVALCFNGLFPIEARADQQWVQPTAEELSMTAQNEVPGAAAVYLYREEIADDMLHSRSIYVRLKILTEAGKRYGDVKIDYGSLFYGSYGEWFYTDVSSIAGRTIHRDGTVIPFTGKAEIRDMVNAKGVKAKEKVFSMPSVEVGSILEYRYSINVAPEWYQVPFWGIQKDLFLRKGLFRWNATSLQFVDQSTGAISTGFAWAAVLPPGKSVTNTFVPQRGSDDAHRVFEMSVQDILPAPDENFMPPIRNFTYRVDFYRAYDGSQDEFWKTEGKAWAKAEEKFIGPTASMADAMQSLKLSGSSITKLQAIYAAVMSMDNTSYSREHDASEDKARGLTAARTAQDIWARKRGNNDQIAKLFIALARAAGYQAYPMRVTSRDRSLFSAAWRSLNQLDDDIAIVVVDGQEKFFDPGARYCPFGQLAWTHSGVEGLREQAGGLAAIAQTPQGNYADSQTQRTGDVVLEADGKAHGVLQVTWMGIRALEWRQKAIVQDETEVKSAMKHWLEGRIEPGMSVELSSIDNLADYEKPLIAHFAVQGMLGTTTGGRLSLPSVFFEAQSKSLFPDAKRETPVDLHFGERVLDGVRIQLPPDVNVESTPKEAQFALRDEASYRSRVDVQGRVVMLRRKFDLTTPFFPVKDYEELRSFYSNIAATDQQQVLLQKAPGKSN
jgi:hypothetical protein